jgi:hypothetical protein
MVQKKAPTTLPQHQHPSTQHIPVLQVNIAQAKKAQKLSLPAVHEKFFKQ